MEEQSISWEKVISFPLALNLLEKRRWTRCHWHHRRSSTRSLVAESPFFSLHTPEDPKKKDTLMQIWWLKLAIKTVNHCGCLEPNGSNKEIQLTVELFWHPYYEQKYNCFLLVLSLFLGFKIKNSSWSCQVLINLESRVETRSQNLSHISQGFCMCHIHFTPRSSKLH